MIVNQTERNRKKIALVANSAWSMYNFRIDLIRHLLLSFDVLIIAPKDEFAEDLKKAGCSYLDIESVPISALPTPTIRRPTRCRP